MITEIRIKNFKSIHKLRFELGRVNVLIGANGSGKSNILEAIAMGAAAHMLDINNQSLSSRGVRVTTLPSRMKSAFDEKTITEPIFFATTSETGFSASYKIQSDDESTYSPWEIESEAKPIEVLRNITDEIAQDKAYQDRIDRTVSEILMEQGYNAYREKQVRREITEITRAVTTGMIVLQRIPIGDFVIFSPEETALRQFHLEGQTEPLGKNGAGLFKYLEHLSQKSEDKWQELKSLLTLLDWFDDMDIPDHLLSGERRLEIRDRYIDPALSYFDQQSANEGFLFLLFYFALMIGEETPKFFAIDNIDASLNPKLCRRLVKLMAELAEKHDKQVIMTTHNPSILDGLNLDDPNQRLFSVWRNGHGHTMMRRILKPQPKNGSKPLKMSEAFVRGYLGALPDNF